MSNQIFVDNHIADPFGATAQGSPLDYIGTDGSQMISNSYLDPRTGIQWNPVLQPTMRRPYYPDKGPNTRYPCVTVNTGQYTVERGERKPILRQERIQDLLNAGIVDPVFLTANATSLRKEQWIQLDQSVLMSARQRLKIVSFLEGKGLVYGGFNGMSKMTLEYEAMSDPGEAVVDMDGMTQGRGDAPLFKLRSLPLYITHSDFFFSERRLAVSRGSTPLDTTMSEAAGRRIGEMVEKTVLGVSGGVSGLSYGGQTTGVTAHDTSTYTAALGASTVYGLASNPFRLTKTNITAPGGSFVPNTARNEILAALEQLRANKFYGPFVIFNSTDWDSYMDQVYAVSGGNNPGETLRTMLTNKTPDISGVERCDFLTSTFTLHIVQLTADVIRMVNGMDITTVQWPSLGGMRQNFKTMCIKVPQLRGDYSGNCGHLHATTT